MEPELYEIDATGTEDEVIEREWKWAQDRQRVSLWHVVAPLVRVIVALVVAMGTKRASEALARAKAVFAPVDVEKELKRLVDGIRAEPPPAALRTWLGPLVEDRARLAREVERLTRERAHDEARAQKLYLGGTATLEGVISERDLARAEVARLTSDRDNLRSEVSMLAGGLNDIFGEGAHPAPREALEQVSGLVRRLRTASPGEAWDRLCNAIGCLRGWPDEAIADAVKAFDAYRAAVERGQKRDVCDRCSGSGEEPGTASERDCSKCGGCGSVPAVEPLTEDEKREAHRFGKVTGIGFAHAQEAIAETKAKRAAEAREPTPMREEPIDAEDLWTDYRTERPHLTASDRLAFLEGVAAARRTATPPRAMREPLPLPPTLNAGTA